MEDTQATSVSLKDINKQIASLQEEIQDIKGLLQNASENTRQDIQETIKCKENLLADLQCKVQSNTDETRCSEHIRMPTEKNACLSKGRST